MYQIANYFFRIWLDIVLFFLQNQVKAGYNDTVVTT